MNNKMNKILDNMNKQIYGIYSTRIILFLAFIILLAMAGVNCPLDQDSTKSYLDDTSTNKTCSSLSKSGIAFIVIALIIYIIMAIIAVKYSK